MIKCIQNTDNIGQNISNYKKALPRGSNISKCCELKQEDRRKVFI